VTEIEFIVKDFRNPVFCIYRLEQEKCFLMFAFPFEVNTKAFPAGLQFE
jgi:hypothetical protein